MDGRTDGYVKIMPLVAPTPQLRMRWTELSWSVAAECGNIHYGTLKWEIEIQQLLWYRMVWLWYKLLWLWNIQDSILKNGEIFFNTYL